MKLLIVTLTILINLTAYSKEYKYPVSEIPESLKKNADAVIRNYSVNINILSQSRVETQESFVITIFNKNAEKLGYFYEYYDKFSSITNYSMNIYTEKGELIKKSKTKDFFDTKAYGGYNLLDDNRVIFNKTYSEKYPYTIEIIFKRIEKQTYSISNWYPVSGYNVSVQNAEYSITTDKNNPIRYKESNLNDSIQIIKHPDKIQYIWQLKDFKALEKEPFGPFYKDIFPNVLITSESFYFDGYNGNVKDWNVFGAWFYNLNKGRDELPESTTKKIRSLVDTISNDTEKIKVIYNYLQENTRYVSIQLGIGGLQPFDASTIDETKYGDCKALSNYMKALLKTVGIESIYTIVRAGSNKPPIDLSFPSHQFNHAILCVPNNGDTIWLECTSQRNPCGYLSDFTSDRNVLLITKEGGKITKTPKYRLNQNTRHQTINIHISNEGNAKYESHTCYNGLQYEKAYKYFYLSHEDKKKKLYKELDIAGLSIDDFYFTNNKSQIPSACRKISGSISKYARLNGNRLLVPINSFSKISTVPKKLKNRKHDIFLKSNAVLIDTINLDLPVTYEIEYLPESLEIKSAFGTYSITITKSSNTIKIIRTFIVKEGHFPSNKYEEFRNYIKSIYNSDKEKLVLIKKD